MTLLNVERIKLFSTRSPYWCLVIVLVVAVAITLPVVMTNGGAFGGLSNGAQWVQFGFSVLMVLSALAITTEYRFGTIRTSFLAVPQRSKVLVAKAALLVIISFVIMAVTSALTYLLAKSLHTGSNDADYDVSSAADWRILWGPAVVGALAAVLGVAVGALVRQSAAALAILLLWPLLVENLFLLFGDFGQRVTPWLPFKAADAVVFGSSLVGSATGPNWWQGLLLFGGVVLVFFGIALAVVQRRDA